MVGAGCAPALVGLLASERESDASDAAAALGNIACFGTMGKLAMVSAGAVPGLVRLLASEREGEAQNAAQALGNIAYDCEAGQ